MVTDYLEGKAGADRFYRGSYRSPGDFRAKAEELNERFDSGRRESLARLIAPVGVEAAAKLEAVLSSNGFVVTTGQQPGLFGGPLYSLYKALTAVRLAETLEHELGKPVMPLFWVASDDHDWAESNHTSLIDGNNELRELTLGPRPTAADATLSRTPLGSGVNEALEALQGALPDSEFSAPWLEKVRSAYRPEATVAAAFRELMSALLAGTPVGMVDAADPVLKTAGAPVMEREILTALEGEEILAKRTGELEAEGYVGQV
ncbi:MAG: bacillithiol biosynthesis cysteine-adding enzyme BshC, partial [Gemmatimonadota bacterium]|nr:bacillithiol biosynthesis cysteine-adding enzyme BshC [Gemmatimonadota bacterium]